MYYLRMQNMETDNIETRLAEAIQLRGGGLFVVDKYKHV